MEFPFPHREPSSSDHATQEFSNNPQLHPIHTHDPFIAPGPSNIAPQGPAPRTPPLGGPYEYLPPNPADPHQFPQLPDPRPQQAPDPAPNQIPTAAPVFDIQTWHQAYTSCQRYFLDHGQHEAGTQALAALINVLLPCQWPQNPIHSSSGTTAAPTEPHNEDNNAQSSRSYPSQRAGYFYPPPSDTNGDAAPRPSERFVSLTPYIRRLVITAHAQPVILHGLFGPRYTGGILPLIEIERRNYLFTAKSVGWARTRAHYSKGGEMGEAVPFLQPLEDVRREEIENAEKQWSRWLAMEDWMVGERAPGRAGNGEGMEGVNRTGNVADEVDGVRIKREDEQ